MREIYAAIAVAAVDMDAPRHPKGQAGATLMTAIGNLAGGVLRVCVRPLG